MEDLFFAEYFPECGVNSGSVDSKNCPSAVENKRSFFGKRLKRLAHYGFHLREPKRKNQSTVWVIMSQRDHIPVALSILDPMKTYLFLLVTGVCQLGQNDGPTYDAYLHALQKSYLPSIDNSL
jgi:hypothetical protein